MRLEVERSCRLLGVWDQSGKLQENQCYVTYRHAGDVAQLIGKVVVMKNPTVHLGGKPANTSLPILESNVTLWHFWVWSGTLCKHLFMIMTRVKLSCGKI